VGRELGGLLYEAVTPSEEHQTKPSTDIELVVDAMKMNLDCALLEAEPACDVPRRDPLDRDTSNLRFSGCEMAPKVMGS
jgi:hypothetical protein